MWTRAVLGFVTVIATAASVPAQQPDISTPRSRPIIELAPAAPGSGTSGDGCDVCTAPPPPAARAAVAPTPSTSAAVPGQVVVGLTLAPPADVARVVRDLESGLGLRRVALAGLPFIAAELVLFEVRPPQTVAGAVAALGADPRVLFAQPNFLFVTTAEHSDPMASLQYGPALLGIPRAHDHATGRGVRVAVIDTGIDPAHPDLAGRVALRANFAEGADGAELHGTAIAGIIAALADNGTGIYGVAPETTIVAARACRPSQPAGIDGVCTAYALGRAFNFAVLNGARVVNVSLAGPPDALMPRLLAAANARGVVVVAAAGNAGPTAPPPYPAAIETAIAVTAVDARSGLYSAAVHGPFVKVAAPGVEVLTTAPGGQYSPRTGTSMAAAHVTGAVALLLQVRPDLTPDAVRRLLESTSRPLGPAAPNPQFGHGLVDACRAVVAALGGQRSC